MIRGLVGHRGSGRATAVFGLLAAFSASAFAVEFPAETETPTQKECLAQHRDAFLVGLDLRNQGRFAEALSMWRAQWAQGNAASAFGICDLHLSDDIPYELLDMTEGLAACSALADSGLALAQGKMSRICWNGLGVERDRSEALRWMEIAAEGGDPMSQERLGLLVLEGRLVPRDMVVAYKWLSLAVMQGYDTAEKWRNTVREKLSPESLAERDRLIRTFSRPRWDYPGRCDASSTPTQKDASGARQRTTSARPPADVLLEDFRAYCLELAGNPDHVRAAVRSAGLAPYHKGRDADAVSAWVIRERDPRATLTLNTEGACAVRFTGVAVADIRAEIERTLTVRGPDKKRDGEDWRYIYAVKYRGSVGFLLLVEHADTGGRQGVLTEIPVEAIERRGEHGVADWLRDQFPE